MPSYAGSQGRSERSAPERRPPRRPSSIAPSSSWPSPSLPHARHGHRTLSAHCLQLPRIEGGRATIDAPVARAYLAGGATTGGLAFVPYGDSAFCPAERSPPVGRQFTCVGP